MTLFDSTFSPKALESAQKYRRTCGRPRVTAVTPLRHVMSKSIQKAFAEHGVMPHGASNRVSACDRPKFTCILDDNSGELMNSPLDLRLSPVVRRSQFKKTTIKYVKSTPKVEKSDNDKKLNVTSMKNHTEEEILLSAQKVSTESIVIRRTKHVSATATQNIKGANPSLILSSMDDNGANMTDRSGSVYTTCQSVEIITATEMSAFRMNKCATSKMINMLGSLNNDMTPICRETESIKPKKIINFETPRRQHDTTAKEKTNSTFTTPADNSGVENFYTPESTPLTKQKSPTSDLNSVRGKSNRKQWTVRRQLSGTFSPMKRPPLRKTMSYNNCKSPVNNRDTSNNKCFKKPTDNQSELKQSPTRDTWTFGSLISSVKQRLTCEWDNKKNQNLSIFQRCASFAGQLTRSNTMRSSEVSNNLKRKRTSSIKENHNTYISHLDKFGKNSPENISISKRYRIQPRRPIH